MSFLDQLFQVLLNSYIASVKLAVILDSQQTTLLDVSSLRLQLRLLHEKIEQALFIVDGIRFFQVELHLCFIKKYVVGKTVLTLQLVDKVFIRALIEHFSIKRMHPRIQLRLPIPSEVLLQMFPQIELGVTENRIRNAVENICVGLSFAPRSLILHLIVQTIKKDVRRTVTNEGSLGPGSRLES
jgi:hypothetical protein